jgi:hypothetical protein
MEGVYMKKLITLMVVACFIFSAHPGFAARGGKKGADRKAYEQAGDRAVFHRASDWFATRGKSKEEKQAIIAEREAKRAEKRAEKEAKRIEKMSRKEERKTKRELKKIETKAGKRGRVGR